MSKLELLLRTITVTAGKKLEVIHSHSELGSITTRGVLPLVELETALYVDGGAFLETLRYQLCLLGPEGEIYEHNLLLLVELTIDCDAAVGYGCTLGSVTEIGVSG
jgi:hypothetical protein